MHSKVACVVTSYPPGRLNSANVQPILKSKLIYSPYDTITTNHIGADSPMSGEMLLRAHRQSSWLTGLIKASMTHILPVEILTVE